MRSPIISVRKCSWNELRNVEVSDKCYICSTSCRFLAELPSAWELQDGWDAQAEQESTVLQPQRVTQSSWFSLRQWKQGLKPSCMSCEVALFDLWQEEIKHSLHACASWEWLLANPAHKLWQQLAVVGLWQWQLLARALRNLSVHQLCSSAGAS